MHVRETTVDLLRRARLLDDARRVRNQYQGIRQRALVRRLLALYGDGRFGRGPQYAEWRERQNGLAREAASIEQARDHRFLVELALRGALATGAGAGIETTADELVGRLRERQVPATTATLAGKAALEALTGVAGPIADVLAATARYLAAAPALDGSHVAALGELSGRRLSVADAAFVTLLDLDRIPHAYEYDFVDDAEEILRSRSATGDGAHEAGAERIVRAVKALVGGRDGTLSAALRDTTRAVPVAKRRTDVIAYARTVIPDLADEFVALKAKDDPARFLAINREYSRRQREANGQLSPAGLSLLHGYEREPHIMLRTIVEWVRAGVIRPNDEVLVIGPRHGNEMAFFRNDLGLKRAIGLDLFDATEDNIVGGDMHDMSFESGRFKLVYCCGTLSYSYAIRRVAREIARVTQRPGYIVLSDAGKRVSGVDPLGRTDPMSTASMLSCFHAYRYDVVFRDEGVPPVLDYYERWPNVGLVLR
jgi:SAM-dependent methyltransferase